MIGNHLKILDIEIKCFGYKEILDVIEANLFSRTYFSFSYANSFIALTARQNVSLRNDIAEFSALFPDGIGIYWASKFLYGKLDLKERVNGTDLYYKILDLAQKSNYKIFFFGGSDKAASLLYQNLKMIYPNLIIGGIIPKGESFDEQILGKMNQTNSDMLFLGLGTPYQEKWIASFGKKTNIPIQIAVGSGIDFLSGTYKRAPKVMRNIGLEWLYRLFLEPKRLWKRYLLGIPHFIFLIVKQKLFSRETF
jgi:N-acetylglucosaminyldiphosphoundecaprenol N-acetyl-beta-D-mannosaminyltransferase